MSDSMMLQDWVTISTPAAGGTVVQNESGWLDVSAYQDACFYLQVGSVSANTTINLQTSPTKDEVFFAASINGTTPAPIATFALISTNAGVRPLLVSRWATEPNQPLAKYLRWQVVAAAATTVTFRIWVTLNQAGYSG